MSTAQGAIEYLLIIGGAILIAAVVMFLLANSGQLGTITTKNSIDILSGSYENLETVVGGGENQCTPVCYENSQCNDGILHNYDYCKNPGKCDSECANLTTPINQCINGDGFCPNNCTYDNTKTNYDSDCVPMPCNSSEDCSQGLCCNGECKAITCIFDNACQTSEPCKIGKCKNIGTCDNKCEFEDIPDCGGGQYSRIITQGDKIFIKKGATEEEMNSAPEPFFPIGEITVGGLTNVYPEFGSNGLNLITGHDTKNLPSSPFNSNLSLRNKATCIQILQKSSENNLMIFDSEEAFYNAKINPDLSDQIVQETIDCLKESPNKDAFMGWYIINEAMWRYQNLNEKRGYVPLGYINALADNIKAVDQNHAIIEVFAFADKSGNIDTFAQNARQWMEKADIVTANFYPFNENGDIGSCCLNPNAPGCNGKKFNWCLDQASDINGAGFVVDTFVNKITLKQKPFLLKLLTWKPIPYNKCRFMAFQGMIHGASGILWFGYSLMDQFGDWTQTWENNKKVARELSSLENLFLIDSTPTGQLTNNPTIETMVKYDGTNYYLFTDNNFSYQTNATFNLSSLGNFSNAIEMPFEASTTEHQLTSNSFTADYQGWEVKVFRLET